MSANNDQERTAEQMKALFGPPPLVRGESEEQYWKWWDAFVEEHKPKRLSAWVAVNDLAIKQWEQNRLQRGSPALIEGAFVRALHDLLQALGPKIDIKPGEIARDYFGA